jgi:phage-related minor tail protein
LFGGGHRRQDMAPSALQVREIQNSLEHEKQKTVTLRRQMAQLEEKLQQQPSSDGNSDAFL